MIRIPQPGEPPSILSQGDDSSSEVSSDADDEDQRFDNWISDSDLKQQCKSLFDDSTFDTAEQAIQHDAEAHRVNLDEICKTLGLDFHGRIRLINYIRKITPQPDHVLKLESTDPIFTSDDYLIPAVEDDPILRIQPPDAWDPSDSELEEEDQKSSDPARQIHALQYQLKKTQDAYSQYREFVQNKMNTAELIAQLGDEPAEPQRDDDTSYFESYAENDIHAVMINDKVRTSSYADFISSASLLFLDATVLDVGCGTGILSLFAARAGAKRVISVDASPIATKARRIVSDNDLSEVITVVQGKVESLPDEIVPGVKEVDVIISEWMGYGLLYESMLDSVLCARDRWLKKPHVPNPEDLATNGAPPTCGIMAPSQCQMLLALCDAGDVSKDRIKFWDDVYGFNMSVMADEVYDDAVTDVISSESLLSDPCVVKDLYLQTATAQDYASFSTPFSLRSTASKRTKVTAFVLYFDTFFAGSGRRLDIEPTTTEDKPLTEGKVRVRTIRPGEGLVADVWPLGGRSRSLARRESEQRGEGESSPSELRRAKRRSTLRDKEVIKSFSTGPMSEPTHWKQTIFFVRKPFVVTGDSTVKGTFYCTRSTTNSREMDVEIHYSMTSEGESSSEDVVVEMYKVR